MSSPVDSLPHFCPHCGWDHPEEHCPQRVAAGLDHATRVREARAGDPSEGPYPASIGEVAREVVAWITGMEAGPARGLAAEVAARLTEPVAERWTERGWEDDGGTIHRPIHPTLAHDATHVRDVMAGEWRRTPTEQAEPLDGAAEPPTDVEWAVRYDEGQVRVKPDREAAEDCARIVVLSYGYEMAAEVVSRRVGPWTPVEAGSS